MTTHYTEEEMREMFEKDFKDTNYRGALTRDAMADFWLSLFREYREQIRREILREKNDQPPYRTEEERRRENDATVKDLIARDY